MIILLNGDEQEVPENTILAELVLLISTASSGIAVALDDQVVPRREWGSTSLNPGARIEVLTAVQGG